MAKLINRSAVIVDTENLSIDGIGDFVQCNDCMSLSLIGIGEERCRLCGSLNLSWANTLQECCVADLIDEGYECTDLYDSDSADLEELEFAF